MLTAVKNFNKKKSIAYGIRQLYLIELLEI